METQQDPSQMTILITATLDTKGNEAVFLRERIESQGCKTLLMNTGIFSIPSEASQEFNPDISREEVAIAGGVPIEELLDSKDKGRCIQTMMVGAGKIAAALHKEGKFQGVIGIGGAQGTDIGTAAMRALPFGLPKFMVATVASGLATFGPYVGTKDIIMMHSVADIQGLNFLTIRVLENAAAAICGMVKASSSRKNAEMSKIPVAMSMLGTTTPGALRAKKILEEAGYESVAFHQNGTGGIAMEEMINEGYFKGVLDLNMHELADSVVGGLHRSIRDFRLESAGKQGIPQVIAPGSVNYSVQGPFDTLAESLKKQKYIIHNPNLTLVRLTREELIEVAKLAAKKINMATGPVHVFIPLQGFSFPDREGLPHWEPESNRIFIETLRENLKSSVPFESVDAHINDDAFTDHVVEKFMSLLST
ncbi:MAG: Tm-1-like ATP-binding domain-containing protein [SAR324 cluster bacterium]|nr:Tm-1-like ATP-binding domain-containing protein [SAR324 cluster bacterium]